MVRQESVLCLISLADIEEHRNVSADVFRYPNYKLQTTNLKPQTTNLKLQTPNNILQPGPFGPAATPALFSSPATEAVLSDWASSHIDHTSDR